MQKILIIALILLALLAGFFLFSRDDKKAEVSQEAPVQQKEAPTPKEEAKPTKPSDNIMHELAAQTLLAFGEAVNKKDIKPFYDYISPSWQQRSDPRELNELFSQYYDGSVDFIALSNSKLTFKRPPEFVEEQFINIEASYELNSHALTFMFVYEYQNKQWNLVDFSIY